MKFVSRVAKAVVWITACLIVIVLGACLMSHFEQNRAEKLTGILSNVEPGVTSQKSVQDALRGELFLTKVSNACESDNRKGCDQFVFSNRWMMHLHLAPAKWIWVTLEYRDGIVISKSVQFAEAPHTSAVTTQVLREFAPSPVSTKSLGRTVSVDAPGSLNVIVKVSDDERVPLDQRQKDWRVDLSCLSRIGTCGDVRTTLPGAFPKR